MSFTSFRFPAVDPHEFLRKPLRERLRILSVNWAENGFGSPGMVPTMYIAKLVFFYALCGVIIATATSGLQFWHVSQWWNQPIVYQKLILWTTLIEVIGVGGSWGPLAGKIKPMVGSIRFWTRPGTIRLRPFTWVLFTGGDRRTWFDVALYVGLLVSLVVALLAPGAPSSSLLERLPDNTTGLVRPALMIAPIVLLIVLGLRDKVIFLAARGEQYLPAFIFFAVLPFTDMIIPLKILIVVAWVGAGVSKFGRHFSRVIGPMTSNSPLIPSKRFKLANYKKFPNDLSPTRLTEFLGHVLGTVVEILAPLVLLFSTNKTVTIIGVIFMLGLHAFIISSFPMAVPLEWNVLFAYASVFLFLGFPAWDGYSVFDMSTPWLMPLIAALLLFFPIFGSFRPDKVSFLPAMRQYAGNWACSVWAFAPGAEEKLYKVTRPVKNTVDQFIDYGFEPQWAQVTMQQPLAFRALHSQGRGLFSVLIKNVPDIDTRTLRDGEFLCNCLIGFNFGDGHMHDERLVAAVQREVGFAPGELIVVCNESQAWGSSVQHYKLIDAAVGVIETGTWKVIDAVSTQPWLPDGPIPTQTTWTRSSVESSEKNRGAHG